MNTNSNYVIHQSENVNDQFVIKVDHAYDRDHHHDVFRVQVISHSFLLNYL